jgi:4-hydroxybenzoyl-CoA thioesterase/acyl-CoA thioester hydrolase
MPFTTRRRVEFRHTDAAGIAHFSMFLLFAEEAEHELLRSLGLSVLMQDEQGPLSWPRVAVKADFQGAVRFEDELDIAVTVARLGEKSVTYHFDFTHDGRAVATAETTAVCCRLSATSPPCSTPIPPHVADKLRSHLSAVP